MLRPDVFVIGGAPGAGKSTLGKALASRLDRLSVSMDDIYTAAKAITSPDSHPALHVMRRPVPGEYFTFTDARQLFADAEAQHDTLWPAIEAVIRSHASWAPPVVIDGWFVSPAKMATLGLANVTPLWLVVEPGVLTARERANFDFFARSPDPERMLHNFLARSFWHNDNIRREATALGQRILFQDGAASVDTLCEAVLSIA